MKTSKDEIREMTAAEIRRRISTYEARRVEVTAELARIFAARMDGTAPAPAPLSDRAKSARARAQDLIGRNTSIVLPPISTREEDLEIERDALILVIDVLNRSELGAQVSESVAWAEEHGDEWRDVCRDAILAAMRLNAAEARASAMIASLVPGAAKLPMTEFIGRHRVGELLFNETALDRAIKEAVAAGIITKSESKGAQ